MVSALGYVDETLVNAEIVKLLLRFLAPLVGGTLSRCLNSHKTFFRTLIPATEQRIQEHSLKVLGHSVPKPVGSNSPVIPNIFFYTTYPRLVQTLETPTEIICLVPHRPTASSGSSKLHRSKGRGQLSA